MKHKTSLIASSLAAVVTVVALGSPVFASPKAPERATTEMQHGQREHHQRGKHHHGIHKEQGALMVPGYGAVSQELLDSLALTEAQKALVDQAQQTQKVVRADQKDIMKQQRESRKAQLAEGKIDPRAQLEARQAQHAKMLKVHAEIDAKWLSVWDALDAGQREKIATHLAARADSTSRR